MDFDVTVKIGGEAGQGIQTIGGLLALICREAGFYLFGVNDFVENLKAVKNIILTDQVLGKLTGGVHGELALIRFLII